MKARVVPSIALAALLYSTLYLSWAVPLALQVGCTTTQQTVQYRTLKAVALSVDSALKAYADAVVAGKVDAATQAKALDLKSRYTDAMTAAIAAAKSSTEPAPASVTAAVDALLSVLGAATKAAPERSGPK